MSRQNEVFPQLLSQPPLPWLIAAAKEHAAPVLLVGGVIRDALRGDPHADLDIAVAGDLEAFIDTFGRYCGRCPVAIGTHGATLDVCDLAIPRLTLAR